MARDDKKDGGAGSFDRDFGYLLPFLDKVAAAGASIGGTAGAELQQLISGEKARWARIRELLAGAPATSSSAAPTRSAGGAAPQRDVGPGASPGTPPPSASRGSEASRQGSGLTVGSLKRR